MTQDNLMIIIAFALYLGLMMYIGVYYYRKSNSIGDYILGGRQLGPWITALSAEASDMSGWMLMGVPGLAYTTGISGVWIAVGLTLGTWANWKFVSRRLRNHTEVASDSLTLPDYLKNRFHDQSHSVAVISALFILIFFLIYTSSGFVAGASYSIPSSVLITPYPSSSPQASSYSTPSSAVSSLYLGRTVFKGH